MNQNKYTKLLSNTIIFGIGTFSSKFLVFLLMPIYSRILSPYDYGIVDIIVSTSNLLIPIVGLSITEGIIRFGLERSVRKSDVFSTGIWAVLCGFAVFLVFSPIFLFIKLITPYTVLIYLYVLCANLKGVCAQFVRARGMVKLYAVDGIFSTAMVILFNILFLVVFRWGITGYVLATILSDLISAVSLFCVAGLKNYLHLFSFNHKVRRAMLIYSIPLIPNTLFWWITNVSDRYLVTYMISPEANGLYSMAYKIPTIITSVSQIFMQAWQMSAFTETSEKSKTRFFSTVFNSYQSIVFLVGSVVIVCIKLITRILVSEAYYESWRYVPLLVMSVIFTCFVSFLGSVYMSAKKNAMSLITTFLGALANVIMNIILIPIYGANGAAFATFASYFFVFLVRAIHSQKLVRIHYDYPRLILNFVIISAQAAIMIAEVKYWLVYEIALLLLMIGINLKGLLRSMMKIFQKAPHGSAGEGGRV